MPRGLFQPASKKQNKKIPACVKQCMKNDSNAQSTIPQPSIRRIWRDKRIIRNNGHKAQEEPSFYLVRRSAKRVAEYEDLKRKFAQLNATHIAGTYCQACDWSQCLVEMYYNIAYFFANDYVDE